jgi:nucleotide-binding universal stress UspA family protein
MRRQALATVEGLDVARRAAAVAALDTAVAEVRAQGRHADYEVLEGDAGPQLDRAARRLGAGLVVVGSRRASPADHYLLGATTEGVLRHSHASVLIVR